MHVPNFPIQLYIYIFSSYACENDYGNVKTVVHIGPNPKQFWTTMTIDNAFCKPKFKSNGPVLVKTARPTEMGVAGTEVTIAVVHRVFMFTHI